MGTNPSSLICETDVVVTPKSRVRGASSTNDSQLKPAINCESGTHVVQSSIEDVIDDVLDEVDQYYDDDDEQKEDVTPRRPHRVASIDSHFKKIDLLGRGASCRVLKVRSEQDQRLYALKELGLANSMQFVQEVELLKKLDHPNILHFVDCYVDDNRYYVRSEYLGGGTLLDKLIRMKRFSERKAISYVKTILSAVQYMHSVGVVHRDLKCKNIAFTKPGTRGVLKIIDLGEGKIVKDGQVYTDIVGTPTYMAPEGLRKSGCTADELRKCDIWSIGVIAYILVCGRAPFRGKSDQDVMRKIVSHSAANELYFPKDASFKFRDFISKLLCADSQKRLSAEDALSHPWLSDDAPCPSTRLSMANYTSSSSNFMDSTSMSSYAFSPEYSRSGLYQGLDETFQAVEPFSDAVTAETAFSPPTPMSTPLAETPETYSE